MVRYEPCVNFIYTLLFFMIYYDFIRYDFLIFNVINVV